MGMWNLTFRSYGALKSGHTFLLSTGQIFCQKILDHIVAMIVLKRFHIVMQCCAASFTINTHFSHVTKSCIFKSLNLREKADRNFRCTSLKNCFKHLKLYSNPPSWLARDSCPMGTFWKTKDWSLHFWEGQTLRFWYVECHHQTRFKSTKTGIFS